MILQEYVYKFNYENDGGVTVDVTTNGKAMAKGSKKKQVPQPSISCLILHLTACLWTQTLSCFNPALSITIGQKIAGPVF